MENKEPKVAIIISVFNQEKLLEKCLKSLKEKKDYENYSVLIIGDRREEEIGKKEVEKIFRKNWDQPDTLQHLINYSEKNLISLPRETRFKIKKVRYNSRPSQFVILLYSFLEIKNPNKLLHSVLTLFFLPLTWMVNLLKLRNQIKVWFRK